MHSLSDQKLAAAPASNFTAELTASVTEGFGQSAAGLARVADAVSAKAGEIAGAQVAADSFLFALRFAAAGAGYAYEQDPAYPLLEKFLTYTGRGHGIGNADTSYHHAALDGQHEYCLSGNRGSCRMIDIEISTLNIADAKQSFVDSAAARGIEIPLGEDFKISLSKNERDGLWLRLPDGPCFIIIRHYYYDWEGEEGPPLLIERVGATYPPPPVDPATVMARSRLLAEWMNSAYLVPNRLAILDQEPNQLIAKRFPQAFMQNSHYMPGYIMCGAGEAAILEFVVPDVKYWNLGIFDAVGGPLQPHMRQASINGHQASIDDDGVFRAVVADRDPGVMNWLDNAGRDVALMMLRLIGSETAPDVTIRVVPFEEVRQHLPAGSRTVTPDERQDMLRRRLLSAYRRGLIDS